MSRRQVAITGIGIVSSLGRGRDAHLSAVVTGRIGVASIRAFDPSAYTCRIAAEIDDTWLGEDHRGPDRFTRIALIAADEAAAQAGLERGTDPTRIGTIIGTGLGGCETLDRSYERLYARGQSRLHPLTIPNIMYNAASSAVSARHHARGPSLSVVSACASSAHAIGQASLWIEGGLCDIVFAGGADAPIAPGIVRAWEALRILASGNDDPPRACRPFSADRTGIILGEGAAVFVLEDLEHARTRGCEILGIVSGFGLSSDAGHLTDPSTDGAARAMTMALSRARLDPQDIGYLNAHGTATRANDATETAAIREVFGSHADHLAVSSTKAMHGHTMGASGAIETAISLLALSADLIPPTMNYTGGDPACNLDYVPNAARAGRIRHFLSNSFAFGGMNGALAITTKHGLTGVRVLRN